MMTVLAGAPRRTRLLAASILLGVFLAGGVAGAAVVHLTSPSEATGAPAPERARVRPARPLSGGERIRVIRTPAGVLEDRLSLTPEQRVEVERIFASRREHIEAVLRELQPRLESQRDSADLEIRAILTPEQREAFDRMIRRRGAARPVGAGGF